MPTAKRRPITLTASTMELLNLCIRVAEVASGDRVEIVHVEIVSHTLSGRLRHGDQEIEFMYVDGALKLGMVWWQFGTSRSTALLEIRTRHEGLTTADGKRPAMRVGTSHVDAHLTLLFD